MTSALEPPLLNKVERCTEPMGPSSRAEAFLPDRPESGDREPAGLRTAATGEIRKLTTLLETSQALSGTPSLRQALHRVLEILGRHHEAIRSTVALLQDDNAEIVVDAFADLTRESQ